MAASLLKLVEEDRRQEDRTLLGSRKVLLVGQLITTTGVFAVRLRDLSRTGAKVEAERLPRVGADLLLKRGPLEVFSTLAWVEDNCGGLCFVEPLKDVSDWLCAPPSLPAAPAPHFRRTGFRGARMSAAERLLAERWARPQGRQAWGE
jgi:hypothetical protein